MLSRPTSRRAALSLALLPIALRGSRLVAGPPRRWPGGARGSVSLTYDDGLDSHLDIAAPALEAHGLRGTFFLTQENVRERADDWRGVAARGHELGNHSVDHPCDLRRFDAAGYARREVLPAERFLDDLAGLGRRRVFAYPCDVTDLGPGDANRQAAAFDALLAGAGMLAARTSEGEPNNPGRVAARRYRLQALAVGYDAPTIAAVGAYLDRAVRHGFWAILVFHDIVATTTERGQVDAALHDRVLAAVAARDLWCAPLGETFEAATRYAPPPSTAINR